MSRRRPLSLGARSTLATGLALLLFLGATGFVLDRAYAEGATSALRERLQSYIYAYLARFDISRYGTLIPPDALPNPEFARPGSGLYAVVTGADGVRWSSPSTMGRELSMNRLLAPARTAFEGPTKTALGRLYILSEGVLWVMPDGKEIPLTFHVAENEHQVQVQLTAFRRTLVYWLAGIGCALLLLQLLLLRWSLSPLTRMANELQRIERGERDRLAGSYPIEVSGLARSLNTFVERERQRIERYRNILSDLAHSLKTPLSVMRSRLELESESMPIPAQEAMTEQVERMNEIVAYQLSRAATSGQPTYAAPIEIEAEAEDLVRSLEKVYADKNILCEFDINPAAIFYGERGDLLELLGNLLENAFKWASHRVMLHADVLPQTGHRRPGLELGVDDDGPGIRGDQIERILQRGVRGDERVQGHGIGLAIVQDIAHGYGADLEVGPSRELGGASFVIRFMPK